MSGNMSVQNNFSTSVAAMLNTASFKDQATRKKVESWHQSVDANTPSNNKALQDMIESGEVTFSSVGEKDAVKNCVVHGNSTSVIGFNTYAMF